MAVEIPESKAVGDVVDALGFSLNAEELKAFTGYLNHVMKWNKVMNLIGPYSWKEALTTLLIDSLHLARFLETLDLPDSPECWDFGAGAGLPGLPLRCVWQRGGYFLVDAREKRTMFMEQVLALHPLPETYVYWGRVEDFMKEKSPADIIVSRAFMPWEKLLSLVEGNIQPAGRVIFLTLEPVPDTLPSGWKVEASFAYDVEGTSRYFWSLMPINAPS